MASDSPPTGDRREVVVDDPELTSEANEALTAEARKALGAKEVPARGRGSGPAEVPGGTDSGFTATLVHNRLLVALSASVALVGGILVSLATEKWLFLGVAVFAHAAVTVIWLLIAVQLMGEPEHAAPEVAAMLEEQGVSDPDARLGQLVEDFTGREARHSASEPASTIDESAPSFMIWLPAVGLLLISAITPFVTDGRGLWLVPAILWPLVIGTLLFAWRKPEGAGRAVAEHPRAMAAAMAFAALGLTLVLIGVAAA